MCARCMESPWCAWMVRSDPLAAGVTLSGAPLLLAHAGAGGGGGPRSGVGGVVRGTGTNMAGGMFESPLPFLL